MTTKDPRPPPVAAGEDRSVRSSDWRLVVPIKARHLAKTRLHPPAGVRRSNLAHAFALDTLAVAAGLLPAGHLVVVTSDPATQMFARRHSAVVVDDDMAGLNPAVRQGLRAVVATVGNGPTGVLLGDLPALSAAALAAALTRCLELPRAMVPDAEGTGTVLLTAQRTGDIVPRFGGGSAAAHEAYGHRRLALDLPRLRTDVDDDTGLAAAARLGLGPHTMSVLGQVRLAQPCGLGRS